MTLTFPPAARPSPRADARQSMNNPETPVITRARIAADLEKLGLQRGGLALVHSSLKSLGRVDGGPETVIDALLDVLGPEGLLVFPSFQKGGEHKLLREGVVFDVRSTPTGQGFLPETFRQRPCVIRSLSPTHCLAACGPGAEEFLAGHEKCTVSVGHGTPFDKFVERGGKILLLGVTHACNTMLHYVENTGGAPTVSRELFTPTVIDAAGQTHTVPTYPHMPGLRRNYERVEPELMAAGAQINGMVGQAVARLVDARAMAQHLGAKLCADPLYLIDVFNPAPTPPVAG